MTHPYELDHASASFLRGYWTGYKGRQAANVTPCARAGYQSGYAAGASDRTEVARRWQAYQLGERQ